MEDATMKKKQKTVAGKVLNILMWVFLGFATLIMIFALVSTLGDKKNPPSIFGKAILTVASESMDRPDEPSEAAFTKGCLILGRKITTEEAKQLDVGDIITFYKDRIDFDKDGNLDSIFITHRIYEKRVDENGNVTFVTKGDNPKTNPITDEEAYNYTVRADEVISIYEGQKIKGVGSALDFLKSSTGFLIFIVIPMLIFFVLELINFIKAFLSIKNEGKKMITASDEELIRQKAIEEYIRQQQEAQNKQAETTQEEPETEEIQK